MWVVQGDDTQTLGRLLEAIVADDPRAIETALEALALEEVEAALPSIFELLRHADYLVRNAAVAAFIESELPAHLGVEAQLLAQLRAEDEEVVRCTICEALETHGSAASVGPLRAAMDRDHWLVRPWAADALGWVDCDEASRAALRIAARVSDEPRLARAAAFSLVMLGERTFVAEATRAALSDDSAAVGLMESLGVVRRRRPREAQELLADFTEFLRRVDTVFPAHRGQAERLRAAVALDS